MYHRNEIEKKCCNVVYSLFACLGLLTLVQIPVEILVLNIHHSLGLQGDQQVLQVPLVTIIQVTLGPSVKVFVSSFHKNMTKKQRICLPDSLHIVGAEIRPVPLEEWRNLDLSVCQ